MKYIFSVTFFAAVLCANAQPQDLPTGVRLSPAVQPPSIVNSRFAELFRANNPAWQQRGDLYMTTVANGPENLRIVYFRPDGELVRTDSLLLDNGRPPHLDRFLDAYDKGKKRPMWLVRDSSGARYLAPFAGDTLWFDSAGRLLPRTNVESVLPEEETRMLQSAASELLLQGSLSELALVNSVSPEVVAEAKESLKKSHETFASLEATAASLGVALPVSLSGSQEKTCQSIGMRTGKAFENHYRRERSRSEKRFARSVRDAKDETNNPALKEWCEGVLVNQ